MAITAAKPTKPAKRTATTPAPETPKAAPVPSAITEELMATYKAEVAKLDAVKRQLKPLTDRTDALHSLLTQLMKRNENTVLSVGVHHLKIVEKRGSVQWKNELALRVDSDELARIEAAVGTSETLVIS